MSGRSNTPTSPRKPSQTLDLERYVPFFLRATANTTSRMTSRVYQDFFGIGIAEWRVLSTLAIEPNITAAKVCEIRSLDAAAVSRSVRVLQQRGDIRTTEDAADGRQHRLVLTAQGRELHDRVVEVALRLEQHFLAGFTATEIELLISLLNRFRENTRVLADSFEKTGVLEDLVLSGTPSGKDAAPWEDSSDVKDRVETRIANGRLHIRADVGSEGITRMQQMLGKYYELLTIMP